MKKLFVAGIAAAALFGTPAIAADLPMKAAAYRATAVPAFNWTGCYVGAQAGSAWGRTSYTDTLDRTGTGFDLQGGVAGGHIGCNYQIGSLVIGIEGDREWASLKGNDGGFEFTTDGINAHWQESIRARAGFAVDRALIYGTGGWSALNVGYSVNNSFIVPETINRTLSGWTAGAGIEYAFTNNITGRVEYRYARYDAKLFPTQQVAERLLNETTTNTIRLGLTYKFDPWGKGPVSAKY